MARAKLSTLDGSLLVRKGEAKPSPFRPVTGDPIDWPTVKHVTGASGATFYDDHHLERNETAAALDRIKEAMAAKNAPTPVANPPMSTPRPEALEKGEPAPETMPKMAVETVSDTVPVARTPIPSEPVREARDAPRSLATANAPIVLGDVKRVKSRQRTFGQAGEKPAPKAEKAVGGAIKKRAALTLRLDPERHLRLKIYSAFTREKIQEVLVRALDQFLDREASDSPDCACLKARRSGTGGD